jgi:NAD(P)-dependent dehydrogenase (short-subunit alcohol dehydrogenase family)
MPMRLSQRTALITGASRGIGQAVAKRFAAEGAHVILVARDKKGLEETDDAIRSLGGAATLAPLDLLQADGIEALAAECAQRFGKLDILVGNAGILGELTPIPHTDPAVFEKVMATNLTANLQLIRHFDPLLKAAEAPRALFVTSDVTDGAYAYWSAYAISKAALEMMVLVYAAEHVKTALKINLVDPGDVRTRLHAQAFPGADPKRLPEPDAITDIFVQLAAVECTDTGKKFRVS